MNTSFEKVALLHEAHSQTQANIWLVRLPEGRQAVMRDYSGKKLLPARLLCRWALRREVTVHRLLEGVKGIPLLIQVLDSDRYLIEWIDGAPLSSFKKTRMSPAFFDELERIVSEMHERKVAHGDLRNKNIMVSSDQHPVVIDFSTAWWGTRWWRVPFFRFLRKLDMRRLAKSKEKFCPDSLTENERRLLSHLPWYHRFGQLYRHGLYPLLKGKKRKQERRS